LSTILVSGLGAFMIGNFGLAPFELPSILCTWIWILGASGSFGYFPINGDELNPELGYN
jgi:hypothetical protein